MPTTIGRAPKTLPAGAKKIYVGAFNGAYDGTCKGEGERRDECASRIAWAAVKKKYKQGKGKKWVKRSLGEIGTELGADYSKLPVGRASFIITKATASEGEMRWVARASDTLEDDLGTRMSQELFKSFIHYSSTSDFKPYLAVSHYGALNGQGIAGPCSEMWIDGVAFKAKGTFKDTSLGRALFGAIVKERNDPSVPKDQRIRLSIAFLDLKHSHNQTTFIRRSLDDKCPACESGLFPSVYLDGVLIHLGATRVPINQRTSIETEGVVQMGAANITRLQDAASIVGDDLAKRLEELTQEGLADDEEGFETQALVVKAEAETETEPVVVKPTKAQAQIQRSRRWGILIRQDGHVTIPLNERGAGATFLDYGDPVNCLFPIWLTKAKGSLTPTMLQHVEGALVQYGLHRDKYDVESQSKIGARIAQARSKFGVEKGTEERSYYVPEPVWTSWGGATTIAAAVDFIEAQDAAHELLSEVDLLEGVFRNILNVPGVEDKATALKNVTEEFAARIGSKPESEGDQTMTVRSEQSTVATEPAVQTIPMVPAAAPAAPTPASAPAVAPVVTQAAVVAPASAVAPAPAAVTPDVVSAASTAVQPAVQAITKFQAGVVGVLNQAELSTEDRLKAIQPLLETMAGAVAESAQSPPDAGTQLVAAFSKAMAAELRPLVEQIQMTLTQLGQGVPQGPARKTYSHVGLVRATPVAEEGKPPSIREIARGSTGLSS